jgi:hypothetical protein
MNRMLDDRHKITKGAVDDAIVVVSKCSPTALSLEFMAELGGGCCRRTAFVRHFGASWAWTDRTSGVSDGTL